MTNNTKKGMTIYFIKVWLLIVTFNLLISGSLLYRLFEIQDDTKGLFMFLITSLAFFFFLKSVLFLSLSSVTIFINLYEPVRKNHFYSLATYCLIPFVIFFCFMVSDLSIDEFDFDMLKSGWKISAILTLPHLIISLIVYLHFRKRWIVKQ
ncbi:hypothetical protein [Flavobacterium chilense]|uniref:Uncharacterized protein n=1 Tax=Flavobacterium chilense TaxID=946677 RepID=A0A1M7DTS3_9FLAO|nr:hypothetical protein [Flavobacterium chilense]SHL82569.1 hypothetical protein SAMN05444484_102709 [Flavobacterium chilense]